MTTTEKQALNGVDVPRLFETLEAVKANPALGKFHFRATSEWQGGAATRTTIKDFYGAGQEDRSRTSAFALESDQPDVLLGGNSAPNPDRGGAARAGLLPDRGDVLQRRGTGHQD